MWFIMEGAFVVGWHHVVYHGGGIWSGMAPCGLSWRGHFVVGWHHVVYHGGGTCSGMAPCGLSWRGHL